VPDGTISTTLEPPAILELGTILSPEITTEIEATPTPPSIFSSVSWKMNVDAYNSDFGMAIGKDTSLLSNRVAIGAVLLPSNRLSRIDHMAAFQFLP
jgi:hypothetical protein